MYDNCIASFPLCVVQDVLRRLRVMPLQPLKPCAAVRMLVGAYSLRCEAFVIVEGLRRPETPQSCTPGAAFRVPVCPSYE